MACEASEHELDRGELGETDGRHAESLVVGRLPSVAAEPGEGSLDHPPPLDQLEAGVFVRTLDDLQLDRLAGELGRELGPGSAAIGKQAGDGRGKRQRT